MSVPVGRRSQGGVEGHPVNRGVVVARAVAADRTGQRTLMAGRLKRLLTDGEPVLKPGPWLLVPAAVPLPDWPVGQPGGEVLEGYQCIGFPFAEEVVARGPAGEWSPGHFALGAA